MDRLENVLSTLLIVEPIALIDLARAVCEGAFAMAHVFLPRAVVNVTIEVFKAAGAVSLYNRKLSLDEPPAACLLYQAPFLAATAQSIPLLSSTNKILVSSSDRSPPCMFSMRISTAIQNQAIAFEVNLVLDVIVDTIPDSFDPILSLLGRGHNEVECTFWCDDLKRRIFGSWTKSDKLRCTLR